MKPLIVFVHIPKTAGSSINAALADAMPNGKAQAHHLLRANPESLEIDKLDWLSAHMHVNDLCTTLRKHTSRPMRVYSILREPSEQVASHYNWMFEIFHRGQSFYRAQPKTAQDMSEAVRGTNNSKPEEICETLLRFAPRFFNMQSRYITGRTELRPALKAMEDQLTKFEYLGASVPELLHEMIGSAPEVRENTSGFYHFDPAVFSAQPIKSLLKERNATDNALFQRVTQEKADALQWT